MFYSIQLLQLQSAQVIIFYFNCFNFKYKIFSCISTGLWRGYIELRGGNSQYVCLFRFSRQCLHFDILQIYNSPSQNVNLYRERCTDFLVNAALARKSRHLFLSRFALWRKRKLYTDEKIRTGRNIEKFLLWICKVFY